MRREVKRQSCDGRVSMTGSHKLIIFRLGFLLLITAAVYGNTLSNGFVWDDISIIVNNPLIETVGNIPRFFLSEDTIEESTGYYRPVTYISFAVDHAIWKGNPAGFHFTNLVLHILVVLLFYAVVAELFKKERQAFIAALLFALHPIAGETVNFLAGGRNTLLSACFALLSLLLYIRKKRLPALASFTVAIFSKEFALLLPVIFLMHDFRLQRDRIRLTGYALYLIPILCYLTLRSYAVQKANFLAGINAAEMVMAPYLVVRYALNMINPFQLKVLYAVQPGMNTGLLCLVVVGLMMSAVYLYRKHDDLLFSFGWFLVFLLPVVNVIPLHATSLMADRYAYFSLMGFALGLAAVIDRVNGRRAVAAVVAICAVYAFIDVTRTTAWKNEIEFFTRMTKDAPDTFVGFKNLGLAYYKKGEIAPAVRNLAVADSKPDISYKFLAGDSYIFWKENMPEQAEKALLKAHDLEPGNPEPYLVLMLMHEQNGNGAQARLYRNKVKELGLEIDGILTARTIELCRAGETYLSRRRYVDAEILFWQALRIDPAYVPALIDMGSVRAEQGNLEAAVQYYNKALAIDPLNAAAHGNLSTLYKMQGRDAEARNEMVTFNEAEAMAAQKKGSASGSRPPARAR